jgi:hypothetical protein
MCNFYLNTSIPKTGNLLAVINDELNYELMKMIPPSLSAIPYN